MAYPPTMADRMSAKLHYGRADAVHYWTCVIKGWLFDRENRRIIPLLWSPSKREGPPIELGREAYEELERRASGADEEYHYRNSSR